jgi:hypothetical protein
MRRLLLPLNILLAVVAALLSLRLYEAATLRIQTPPAPEAAGPVGELPLPEAAQAQLPPLAAFEVIAERNLFSPTRSEVVPEPPARSAPSAAAPPAPKPRLYGVVLLPDGRARAYLEDVQRRRVFAYSVGDTVADAKVEQIRPDRVVLRRGRETFEVLLQDPTKPRTPTASPSVQLPGAESAQGETRQPVAPSSPGLPGPRPVRPRPVPLPQPGTPPAAPQEPNAEE